MILSKDGHPKGLFHIFQSLEKLVRAEGVQIECLKETGGQF